ncbi:hypothetical protein ACIBF5_09610 [Micromonospora sp. NPDC050417]|uniref:hypothetical protein n=1 Tax=Micromonospora sp. NPDC050417 TaxID=3364280 RepID=UPI003796D0FC
MSSREIPDHGPVLAERYDLAAISREQDTRTPPPAREETLAEEQARHREDLLAVFPPPPGRLPARGR